MVLYAGWNCIWLCKGTAFRGYYEKHQRADDERRAELNLWVSTGKEEEKLKETEI